VNFFLKICFRTSGTKKFAGKFLVQILQYTKNLELFTFQLALWNHEWILLKPGVQVNIGYGIIENENRVTGKSKIPQECKNGDFGATGGYISGHWTIK
jgi:hypothetical protein